MSDSYYDCIDCGSEFCPCELAETGDCLMCSRLAGKDKCECYWKGVCIYNEFVHAGKKAAVRREEAEAEVVQRKKYGDDITVLIIDVGRSFAIKAAVPGAYVFLKAAEDSSFYNFPISILKSDTENGTIHVAVKAIGSKSKKFLNLGNKVTVRGVYKNGILGVSSLMKPGDGTDKRKRLAIVTKGIGFAPAAHLTEWISGHAETDLFIDTDKVDEGFIEEYMPENVNGKVKYVNLSEEFTGKGVKTDESLVQCLKTNGYDRVAVLTSDYYIKEIGKIVNADAVSNNFHLCCGEGVCGACGYTDKNGRCFKMCKCAEILAEML